MEDFVGFLLDNYIYIAIVAGFLILALLGYIIDMTKTERLKRKYSQEKEAVANIPVAVVNNNTGVNETTILSSQPVNDDAEKYVGEVPGVSFNQLSNEHTDQGQTSI